MKNLSTYLVVMFMVMYWMFRVILAVTDTIGINLGVTIPNYTTEIVMLFATIAFIVLVYKRKILGAVFYLLTYSVYLGGPLIQQITSLLGAETEFNINIYTDIFANSIGIIIAIAVLFDLLLDKNRQAHPVDKKTDWFYKNEKFDREMDERADKNNYRTL